MASNPPGSCCYKGVKHDGTPTGTYETVADFEAYVKYPEDKSTEKGILLYGQEPFPPLCSSGELSRSLTNLSTASPT